MFRKDAEAHLSKLRVDQLYRDGKWHPVWLVKPRGFETPIATITVPEGASRMDTSSVVSAIERLTYSRKQR